MRREGVLSPGSRVVSGWGATPVSRVTTSWMRPHSFSPTGTVQPEQQVASQRSAMHWKRLM
jgi:hypothetical protein